MNDGLIIIVVIILLFLLLRRIDLSEKNSPKKPFQEQAVPPTPATPQPKNQEISPTPQPEKIEPDTKIYERSLAKLNSEEQGSWRDFENRELKAETQNLKQLMRMKSKMGLVEFQHWLGKQHSTTNSSCQFHVQIEQLDQSEIEDYAFFPADYRYFTEKTGLLSWSDGFVGPSMCQPFQLKELEGKLNNYLSGEVIFRDEETTGFLNQFRFTCLEDENRSIADIAEELEIADWYILAVGEALSSWLILSVDNEAYELCWVDGDFDPSEAEKLTLMNWFDSSLFGHLARNYVPLSELLKKSNFEESSF